VHGRMCVLGGGLSLGMTRGALSRSWDGTHVCLHTWSSLTSTVLGCVCVPGVASARVPVRSLHTPPTVGLLLAGVVTTTSSAVPSGYGVCDCGDT
jgi:hypothetical protein